MPSSFLPSNWKPGDVYTANTAVLSANNPQFINGPTPLPAGLKLKDVTTVDNYNFALKLSSPCVGKGYINFGAKAEVPVDAKFGVTELTPPGRDIGAYQTNGTGNQHY